MFGYPPTRNGKVFGSPMNKAFKAVFKAITKGLVEDGFVQIQGFGTFRLHHKPPRPGKMITWVNGKTVLYQGVQPALTRVTFRPSIGLRKLVNEGIEDDGD